MNLPIFDQTRKNENSAYGEAVRLSNELRAVQAHQIQRIEVNNFGQEELKTYNIPAKWGFDCETAPISDFNTWLNDTTIKKSQALFWFVIRTMAIRFPESHTNIKLNLNPKHHLEFDLVLSQMKNEVEWIGTVGFSNMVRLDKSIMDRRNKVVKLNDDVYKVVRKNVN